MLLKIKQNLIRGTVLILLLTLLGSSHLVSQSSFSYSSLDNKKSIGLFSYDGLLRSVADYDIISLPPFTFLSIGKIKKVNVVSNSCVYVLLEYPKKQYVLIVSEDSKESFLFSSLEWEAIDKFQYDQCFDFEEEIVQRSGRVSFLKESDGVAISILNIKKDNVRLFQYMAESIRSN